MNKKAREESECASPAYEFEFLHILVASVQTPAIY